VAPYDVRALFNEQHLLLTIAWCVFTTQYGWFMHTQSHLRRWLDSNMIWLHLFQSVYYLLKPTKIEMKSVCVGEDFEICENLNGKMFNHSFSYKKLTLAEKIDRFKTLFDCEVITEREIKVVITTRATLRTVLALCVNPYVQVIIRRQPTFYLAFVVQALFIGVVLSATRYFAQRRDKKMLEMSFWFYDSRLFLA
jgi:hypothetical protein